MLRSVDSGVRQPVELRPSTQTAKTEGGGEPLATYTSKADGSEHSVAITSPSQKILGHRDRRHPRFLSSRTSARPRPGLPSA